MVVQVAIEEELLAEVCQFGDQETADAAVRVALTEFVARRRPSLAEEQHRLACQYPNEYVVLVGPKVVHHSPDIEEAGKAYDRAVLASPAQRPVFVKPGDKPQPKPIVRGRRFAGRLPR